MKKNLSRRSFIKNSAYASLAAGLSSTLGCGSGSKSNGKLPFSTRQAVVIGSGFGGSVAALRLGEAGISTALIERGKYWAYTDEDSFPTLASGFAGDKRTTWLSDFDANTGQIPVERYTGMLERVPGDTTYGVVGAGLGGGSLVYGGVLLQPKQEIFEQVFPHISYAEMDAVYYPRVLNLVSGGPIPDDILATDNYAAKRAFIDNATAAGMDIVKSHVGFDWDVIRQEVTGAITPFASVGDYVYSCNSNAKNTLDKNYISMAVATGNVEVHTLHNVNTIVERFGGGYRVYCDVLNEDGSVAYEHVINCQYVFMAAGSINTTKLLLKAKALGDLRGLNSQVGQNWGGNGDELTARMGVSSHSLGAIQGGPASIAAFDLNNAIKSVGFMHSPANQGFPYPTQLQMGMCVPDKLGSISYSLAMDQAYINWPLADNANSRLAIMNSLDKITAQSGGTSLNADAIGGLAIWHPIGGVTMNEACDGDTGEIYGQPNIFVVDGAVMPGSTAAANPSLTIAANAERMMENIIPQII